MNEDYILKRLIVFIQKQLKSDLENLLEYILNLFSLVTEIDSEVIWTDLIKIL